MKWLIISCNYSSFRGSHIFIWVKTKPPHINNAEDYGGKASMMVHTMLLSKPEQVNQITTELHDGNVILIDFTPLTSDQETLHKILAELERAVADIDGDLVGVSQKWIVVTPKSVRVSRKKLSD